MRAIDLGRYTKDQLDLIDQDALLLTLDNLGAFCKYYEIDAKEIPGPKCIDLCDFVRCMNLRYTYQLELLEDTNCFEKFIIAYAIGGYHRSSRHNSRTREEVLQAISDVCYYMACNGYRMTFSGTISESVELHVFEFDLFNSFCVESTIDELLQYNFENEIHFSRESTKPLPAEQEVYKPALPADLLEHLRGKCTTEEIVLEVCRLQMLGPKYRRADDALESLINAWNISKETLK